MEPLPIWSTNPQLSVRIEKLTRAKEIAAEYKSDVEVNWITMTLDFKTPSDISYEEEFEMVARVTAVMEGR